MKRAKTPKQIKNMNTTNQNNNIAAPSVTIAPRNPAKGGPCGRPPVVTLTSISRLGRETVFARLAREMTHWNCQRAKQRPSRPL